MNMLLEISNRNRNSEWSPLKHHYEFRPGQMAYSSWCFNGKHCLSPRENTNRTPWWIELWGSNAAWSNAHAEPNSVIVDWDGLSPRLHSRCVLGGCPKPADLEDLEVLAQIKMRVELVVVVCWMSEGPFWADEVNVFGDWRIWLS